MPTMSLEGRRIEVRGTVQGVGFRPFIHRLAGEERVSGCVRNDARGVTIEAFAPEAREGFEIVASQGEGERRVSIPPDLATCPECLREVQDPADRRHGYPLTNRTHCGPPHTTA